ncbi:MAG: ABC transporter ATP-binding protein [candidate division NC10 bacterium]|nr:ABC transporter ATP-binding protein [candidate division NC10 bacterium]
MIHLIEVYKSFQGQQVLKGITLEIPKGQITAIIGRSGSGKTVLLKHLIGLIRPDRGRVLVDGVDIGTLRGRVLDKLRDRFGMLFQGGALFDSLTVFDNVAFPLREKTRMPEAEIRKRVEEKLQAVGLAGMGHKYPVELSGGMKKRAALARALIMDPEIVLFDEPTTGLDPIMLNAIHRLIVETQKVLGFTAVVVSHDIPEIFDIAHRVAVIHDGSIVAYDSPEGIQGSQDPLIRQFMTGGVQGPSNLSRIVQEDL